MSGFWWKFASVEACNGDRQIAQVISHGTLSCQIWAYILQKCGENKAERQIVSFYHHIFCRIRCSVFTVFFLTVCHSQQLKRSSNNEHESESEKVIKQIMQMTEHNERLHTQINAKKKELAKNGKFTACLCFYLVFILLFSMLNI